MRVKIGGLPVLSTVCALLLATAGCTSGGGETPGRGGAVSTGVGTGGGAPGGDPSVPLTAPRLERAALASKDLPGFQVSAEKSALAPTGQPTADKRECQPLADAMGDKPDPRAMYTVDRGLGSLDDLGLAISVSLGAYVMTDAEKLMDGLEAALAVCGGGFEATLDDRSSTYSQVGAEPFTARGGDGTVSWTIVATHEGAVSPMHIVVVRKGATVARFIAFDLGGRKPPRVPEEVVGRQLAKVAQEPAG
ncbi:hypothetical protein [Streptomyces sp. NPDC003023]|uniref:hypothetical protein n=1 Tax=Streptomyces sp. NPDC003023 TaxID=3364675 RepID=UPI0036C9DB9D